MGKVIMVSDEIYEELKRLKRPGESFSDVIRRLLSRKSKLSDIAGRKTISKKDWDMLRKIFSSRNEMDRIRREVLLKILGEK